ncbi:MAG TPA: PEGA domain-containing protein, partial [Kofleriaceae bacterium]
MRIAAVLAIALGTARLAHAAPAPEPMLEPMLEIDDCKQIDLARAEIDKQGYEHYERGATLYAQGDYEGTVRELVYGYCLVPSFYSLLKDIGQAYERNLDYERAVAYFERYVRAVPADAKPDAQQDKANVARRVEVLRKLRAKIYVESTPPGAQITIGNAAGVAALARAGDTIEVVAGHYDLTTELDGYVARRQAIEVKIGKPYTYFVPLVAQKGRLEMQVSPPDARIFLGDRLVGIGHIDVELAGNTYTLTSEAAGRVTDKRQVAVLANQVQRVQVELVAQRQTGRRQLIAYTTGTGAIATAGLLYGFHNTGLTALGAAAGGAAGLLGSIFYFPDHLALGTSNLTITTTLGGGVLGAGEVLLFTDRQSVLEPVIGASVVVAGIAGYLIGEATHIQTGDAALFNSGVLWGGVAGSLFAVSFDPGRVVGGGLVLSGLAMGTLSGV